VFEGVVEIIHPKRQKIAEIDSPFLPKSGCHREEVLSKMKIG